MIRRAVSLLWWRTLAVACLILAAVGVVVPGLPTVPFLLVAAWAGGHGWPRLEAWLLNHPRWGVPIRAWRERGSVSRRVKWIACSMMTLSAVILWTTGAPLAVKIGVPVVMLCVAVWMVLRPEN